MAETVSIELPDVGEAGWVDDDCDKVKVGGYTYLPKWIDAQIAELRESLARLEKAKVFVESERRSQRAEEAARIFFNAVVADVGADWECLGAEARQRYVGGAEALLDAIDSGLD